MSDVRQATRAKEAHQTSLLAKPNVVGVGVGLRQRRVEDDGVRRRQRRVQASVP